MLFSGIQDSEWQSLGDCLMRLYLSGWNATTGEREQAVIDHGYIRYRCFSFANLVKLPGLPYCSKNTIGAYNACVSSGVGIMHDSGVVSWRTHMNTLAKQGKTKQLAEMLTEQEFIQSYVDRVKAESHNWDDAPQNKSRFYMTIDLARVSSDIFRRHEALEALGIRPIPVLHGDDNVEKYIGKYADRGYKLIALATAKVLRNSRSQFRAYLEACFNAGAKYGVEFHGLGITSPSRMIELPWFSTDSSSWSRVAGYGGIMMYDDRRQRLDTFHISDQVSAGKGHEMKLNSRMMAFVKEYVEHKGYDFHALQTDFVQRHCFNSRSMDELTQAATKLHGSKEGSFNLLFS